MAPGQVPADREGPPQSGLQSRTVETSGLTRVRMTGLIQVSARSSVPWPHCWPAIGVAVTEDPRLGGLEDRISFSCGSGGWKSEVPVSQGWSSWGLSPGHATAVTSFCPHRVVPVPCVCVLSFSVHKDTSPPGSGPTLRTSVRRVHLFRGPRPNTVAPDALGARAEGPALTRGPRAVARRSRTRFPLRGLNPWPEEKSAWMALQTHSRPSPAGCALGDSGPLRQGRVGAATWSGRNAEPAGCKDGFIRTEFAVPPRPPHCHRSRPELTGQRPEACRAGMAAGFCGARASLASSRSESPRRRCPLRCRVPSLCGQRRKPGATGF